MTATYVDAEASTPSIQAVAKPRRPILCRHRTPDWSEPPPAPRLTCRPAGRHRQKLLPRNTLQRRHQSATSRSILSRSSSVVIMIIKIGEATDGRTSRSRDERLLHSDTLSQTDALPGARLCSDSHSADDLTLVDEPRSRAFGCRGLRLFDAFNSLPVAPAHGPESDLYPKYCKTRWEIHVASSFTDLKVGVSHLLSPSLWPDHARIISF